jgi:hypothetical protein
MIPQMSLLLLIDIQIDVKIRFELFLLEYLRDSWPVASHASSY